MTGLRLPPLLTGIATVDDPQAVAVMMAAEGCDAGTMLYNIGGEDLRAALILAPDVPLVQAMAMLPACGIGFQNALGAVAPPEVAVHLDWDGGIRVNGGLCGRLTPRSSTTDPGALPDWLIIGLQLQLWPADHDTGHTPDITALYAEGCADVDPAHLLESWARHTLIWINRWQDDGPRPLHGELVGLMPERGKDDIIGLDEDFGLLRRSGDTTHLIPLTTLLEPS